MTVQTGASKADPANYTGNSLRPESAVGREAAEVRHERWAHVHVNWTAVWVGALAAFSALLVFGLVGIALGAHLAGPENRVVDLHRLASGSMIWSLVFSICSAFFAFVIGGWVAGKVAGILHAEPGMLHGAIAWVVAVPILLGAAALGAGSSYAGWYGGLNAASGSANAPFVRPEPLNANPTAEEITHYRTQQAEYAQQVRQWNEETPRAIRNSALGALTMLLLGLIGAVIGGWMASGEPMNFTHHLTRKPIYHSV